MFFRPYSPVDLTGCSSTTGISENGGKGHNGGVWEWTSTVFDYYEGFEPSRRYPGCVSFYQDHLQLILMLGDRFSQDFFDSHHQVVVRLLSFCLD